MEQAKILVLDSELESLKQVEDARAGRIQVITASNALEALQKIRAEQPHLAVIDLGLALSSSPEREGMDVLKEFLGSNHHLKVIIGAPVAQKETAMKLLQMGAFSYFHKPVDLNELQVIIRQALHMRDLEVENELLQSHLQDDSSIASIIGTCPDMEKVISMIRKVADTDANLLIQGEGGTGKELVARAIHFRSSRRRAPFVTVNCGAVPASLLESELFGHEKGAFSGAHTVRRGKLELADGGTLFLDEVAEIPPPLQVKILRFLQDCNVERLGGAQPIEVDARVLAATNRDLDKLMRSGEFREDLYFRLGVITVSLPPLRERGDDVFLLARHFLQKYSQEMSKEIREFSREATVAMRNYSWPGNIRELENKVKRGVIISQGAVIRSQDMGLEGDHLNSFLSLKEARRELDIRYIKHALQKSRGNISKASKDLGISRVGLHELLKRYALR